MNVRAIRVKARELKVQNYSRMKKEELIRSIQSAEGNSDCFMRIDDCQVSECCWRSDCLSS
jgi:hypothetical protein